MARKRGEAHFLWRLLLIPAFALYISFFDCFEFLLKPQSINFVEYARNFLFLGASLIGLMCLICASPSRRLLLSVGVVLLTLPVWLDTGYHMGAAGKAIDEIKAADLPNVILTASGCLWGTLMVRGPKGREWEKTILFLILLARVSAILMWPKAQVIWFMDASLFAFSVLVGALADCVYRGPCLADLLIPVVAGGWILLIGWYKSLDISLVMYAMIALSLVLITYFLCTKPAKKMYLGFILTLFGVMTVSGMYLINAAEIL